MQTSTLRGTKRQCWVATTVEIRTRQLVAAESRDRKLSSAWSGIRWTRRCVAHSVSKPSWYSECSRKYAALHISNKCTRL